MRNSLRETTRFKNRGVKKMKTRYSLKLALTCTLATVLILVFSGIAFAELAVVDRDILNNQLTEQIMRNTDMLSQVEVDVDGDDSQLGDQPGDVNDDGDMGTQDNTDIPDGGSDGSSTQDIPDGGDDGTSTQDVPDDGQDDNPDVPEDNDQDERDELPFTGGNSLFFFVVGLISVLFGITVFAGYKLAQSKK